MNASSREERFGAQILDARTHALATRHTNAGDGAPTQRMIAFKVDRDLYGLPMQAASHVLPFAAGTPVPKARRALLGIISVRGTIYNVLETSLLLNGVSASDLAIDPGQGHIILLRTPLPRFGLGCSRVLGIADIEVLDAAEASAQSRRAVTGYGRARNGGGELQDAQIALLDLDRLLAAFQSDRQESSA